MKVKVYTLGHKNFSFVFVFVSTGVAIFAFIFFVILSIFFTIHNIRSIRRQIFTGIYNKTETKKKMKDGNYSDQPPPYSQIGGM